jgi:predicted metal-dependent phosphoesterase TrpH
MSRIKTLIHLHTDFSFDSDLSLETLAAFLQREEFGCVAVTDHDTIEGARRLKPLTNAEVIIGEEVTTRDGHLIGLFLQKRVRPGMSARATADAIHEQGGLVLLPHPFIRLFGCALGGKSFELVERVDAVETFNAQSFWSGPDRQALRFARRFGLPAYVGADSHLAASIAPCYQYLDAFASPPDFLHALRTATFVRRRHPVSYFVTSAIRTARFIAGWSLGSACGRNALAKSSSPAEFPHADDGSGNTMDSAALLH